MQTTSNEPSRSGGSGSEGPREVGNARGESPEPAPPGFPNWVWLAGAGGLLAIGWLFILIQNNFHLTAPVVFVCLGYGAGVAAVYTLFRTGASAVSSTEEGADHESWGRPVGARAELEREKRALLKAIKEAEFDLQMGKLSKSDAEAMIASYRAQAIEVIKEIDRKAGAEATAREQIEREVRARLEVAKAKKGAEADKRLPGKKGEKGKRGGASAKRGDAAEPAKAAPKVDERIIDAAAKAGEVEAKADDVEPEAGADEAEAEAGEAEAKMAEAAEPEAAESEAAEPEAAEPETAEAADAEAKIAEAAVANDASGTQVSAKEATP